MTTSIKTAKKFYSPLLKKGGALPILGLLVGLIAFHSTAQANTPNYTIEVIIFENLALKGWTEERWPDEIGLPNTDNSVSLSAPQKSRLYLKKRKTQLKNVSAKVAKNYRILFHQAWSQNAYSPKKTPTVLIENDRTGSSNLLGTVKLYKTRFAHVQLDLEIKKRIPSKIRKAVAQNQQVNLEYLPTHWRFNLVESRKIKPGELHYIDHPLFGILVQIHKNN
ncbi:hypothetical protein MNBD_GAMMA04-2364 [hydrothermal vent metagenome]|uniref:Peptidoglycan-binding protein CsiV n=1 Tax=hydrothermal vent metagenome TaxID=652676 RepID=A0A3B0W9Z2_9ZZZZ